jgi:hypothetical protein
MTTLRESAQQALEALELAYGYSMKREEAIEALRAALAEPPTNPAPGYCKHCKQYTIEEPLPAEPVQEREWATKFTWEDTLMRCIDHHAAELFRLRAKVQQLEALPQRKPLTLKDVERLIYEETKINPNVADDRELLGYIVNAVRAVERAHGIGEKE